MFDYAHHALRCQDRSINTHLYPPPHCPPESSWPAQEHSCDYRCIYNVALASTYSTKRGRHDKPQECVCVTVLLHDIVAAFVLLPRRLHWNVGYKLFMLRHIILTLINGPCTFIAHIPHETIYHVLYQLSSSVICVSYVLAACNVCTCAVKYHTYQLSHFYSAKSLFILVSQIEYEIPAFLTKKSKTDQRAELPGIQQWNIYIS